MHHFKPFRVIVCLALGLLGSAPAASQADSFLGGQSVHMQLVTTTSGDLWGDIPAGRYSVVADYGSQTISPSAVFSTPFGGAFRVAISDSLIEISYTDQLQATSFSPTLPEGFLFTWGDPISYLPLVHTSSFGGNFYCNCSSIWGPTSGFIDLGIPPASGAGVPWEFGDFVNVSLTPLPPAPVPEPETYAMLLAGLLLGFATRRKKSKVA